MKILSSIAFMSVLVIFSLTSINAIATSTTDLVRCSDTTYLSSNMGAVCGGDTLTRGLINVTPSGNVSVLIQNALASPFNLYEVYWLSIGDPVTSARLLGNFVTDCKGNSVKNSGLPGVSLVKPITMAADIATTTPTNIFTTVGNQSSGIFLVYSRGPYSYQSATAPCKTTKLSEYNTTNSQHDNTVARNMTPFANPTVTPGVDTPGTNLQFLSGYTH